MTRTTTIIMVSNKQLAAVMADIAPTETQLLLRFSVGISEKGIITLQQNSCDNNVIAIHHPQWFSLFH